MSLLNGRKPVASSAIWLGDSSFDSRRRGRAQTPRDEKRLEFRPHPTGETGSDGEECGAAFSKTAGCRFDSRPTCPLVTLNLSDPQRHDAQPLLHASTSTGA